MPLLVGKFLMLVTRTAVLNQVLLLLAMHRDSHSCSSSRIQEPSIQILNCTAQGNPYDPVTGEAREGADQEDDPRGELVADESGEDPKVFPDVSGHAEHGKLVLVDPKDRLQGVRVEGEVVGVP